jgi:hypothetical protein
MLFRSLTALTAHVAPLVNHSAENLRKNPFYATLLRSHLKQQRGAAALLSERSRDLAVIEAKLRSSLLTIAVLEADKRRLSELIERYLPGLNTQVSVIAETPPVLHEDGAAIKAFESTAHALALVVARIDGIEVDYERAEIRDAAARPGEQLIVGKNYAQAFVEWLKRRPI